MKTIEKLPESLINEKRVSVRWGFLLAAAVFVLTYIPWLTSERELFRYEGLYATCAEEYMPGLPVTAHGVVQGKVFPLYPMTVALVQDVFKNMPAETALRLVSVTMMAAWALLAAAVVARRRNIRSGMVTLCCSTGSLLMMEKGINGGPETMTAFFILAAQLTFFHFGSRRADWNSAWIWSALFISLGFLSGGLIAILFFVFPMFFFRRPLSLRSKFNTPGFWGGIVIVSVFVVLWAVPTGLALRETTKLTLEDFSGNYFKDLLTFPFAFPMRMLPWFILGWMPFCVALQAIDPTPVFSRYLRTLFFSSLFLLWVIPGIISTEWIFATGPLSVMTGLYYELGVRRFGGMLRKFLTVVEICLAGVLFAVAGFQLLPDEILAFFGDPARMSFRTEYNYLWLTVIFSVVLLGMWLIFHFGRKKLPVWILILIFSGGLAIFYSSIMLPYRVKKQEWRNLGRDISNALAKEQDADALYKYKINGMYCGLFYTGKKVHRWMAPELLRGKNCIYVISTDIPRDPRRTWSPLLPENYRFDDTPVSLWKGELRKDIADWEKRDDEA